jgi:epoxyqueuosine reductase
LPNIQESDGRAEPVDPLQLTHHIKQAAREAGFAACGISRAECLTDEARRLELWLNEDRQGQMEYLARDFDRRIDPRRLLPEARSVISVAASYFPGELPAWNSPFRISKYALGRDYHRVMRKKLKRLVVSMQGIVGEFAFRLTVDSAPIMEKAWAARCGLGWYGKNGVLISPGEGSFFFLGEIITDLALDYDHPVPDQCGRCRLCLEACPTGAIYQPHRIDPRRCLSYLTIEYSGPLPAETTAGRNRWIFGCDICQDVCPFNRFARPCDDDDFGTPRDVFSLTERQWRALAPDDFARFFQASAVKRAGYDRLMRNILCASKIDER